MASPFLQLLWLLLLQLFPFTSAQTYQNVSLGSSLSTLDSNSSWTSPSGEFSFGFHPTKQKDSFLLAIWFARISLTTIVWTANEGKPVQKGSKVQLSSNGVLSLSSPRGDVVWKADTNSTEVSSAAMLDSGNFVLTSKDSIIWGTFDHPSDTILPTQILGFGGTLTSRLTEDDNYTPGTFQLILQADGNLVLYTLSRRTYGQDTPYWASNTMNNGSELIFSQSGKIYLTLLDGGQFNITVGVPLPTRDFYHRATLDFDGVFRQFTYPRNSPGNGSWSFSWSIPDNICKKEYGDVRSGFCGINSYCKLKDQRPTCECPPGYGYFDPNNTYGGCRQNFVSQSCDTDEARITYGYEMQPIPSMDWYDADYASFQSVTEEWCGKTCLSNCLCAAAITREGNCELKRFPLLNGGVELGSKGKALIKVGKSSKEQVPPPVIGKKKNIDRWIIPGSVLLGSSAFLNLLLIPLFIYYAFHKKLFKKRPNTRTFEVNVRSFTYKELEEATDGFKEELGHGASSVVYKGRLQLVTERFVAVKKLDKVVREVDKEFATEVSTIGQANHKNLVQLLGFCKEGTHRLLVYEYMGNGSLADLLFGSSRPDWSLRVQIAFGIARGLAYLHEDCCTQIIHCDIKPQNILIDDSLMPRISDFGLAKLLMSNQSRTSTFIRGTRGYVAPEWYKNMPISAKVDVYSYGIVLLEVICCRKNMKFEEGTEDTCILSDWAYDCCIERKLKLLVQNDEEAKNDIRILERMVMVALWSIQEEPSLRPSMKKVADMLEGSVDVPMPPHPSSFIT